MMSTFLDCLERTEDTAVALVDETEALTYGELRLQARQAAAALGAKYGSGRYFVIKATPTVRFVTTFLGAMYSGNSPMPVDPGLPPAGVELIRQKSGGAAILDPLGRDDLRGRQPMDHRDASIPALILFTSGTTGCPKGVIISNDNLLHACTTISRYLDYARHRSAAVVLPLHYGYALLSQVCCQLASGGRVRLFRDLRNPLKFSQGVNEAGLETLCGVPSTFHALTTFHGISRLCMPSVRVLCSAGAAMDFSRFRTIKEIFPEATFFNNYGMTEAAPRIAYIREDDARFPEPTCGRPMEGVEVKVVDPETMRDLADGERGMLVVRGPNITSGYLNDPASTERAFTPDGYLISGDIAYLRDGYIFICGRHDDVFNSGGEKIAPLEIERALNTIDGVEMSAVIGMPDEQRGAVPVAFLKLAHAVSRRDVVGWLALQLSDTKIPLRYFEVNAFPMTSNGKLRRKDLSPEDPGYVIRELH